MFKDREEAGELLALKLKKIVRREDFVVVPLLRGGIILGKKIADYFKIPQKPLAVKKLGAPLNPELGIGAVASDKTYYFNERLIGDLNITSDYKKAVLENRYKEAKALQNKIDKNIRQIPWEGKTAIVVDDGVAIGNTAICASLFLRKRGIKKIILAIPVISKDTFSIIKKYFDEVISLEVVEGLGAVGEFYRHFPQVEDEGVMRNL